MFNKPSARQIAARRKMEQEPISELYNMEARYTATNQTQAETCVQNKGYIIGSIDQYGRFSISNTPVIHSNDVSAYAEAKRLAVSNPGKTFVPMKLVAGFRTGGMLQF